MNAEKNRIPLAKQKADTHNSIGTSVPSFLKPVDSSFLLSMWPVDSRAWKALNDASCFALVFILVQCEQKCDKRGE